MALTARDAAIKALASMRRERDFSNRVLDHLLKTDAVNPRDRKLATRLFYGVVERTITLDAVLAHCSSVALKKMHPTVLDILRVGCYQLLFMDAIPDSAAVNEAVNQTKRYGQARASKFVNGVLRGVQRKGREFLDNLPDTPDGRAVKYACPVELQRLWQQGYGDDVAAQLIAHINDIPPVSLRVNTNRADSETVAAFLAENGIAAQPSTMVSHAFAIAGGVDGEKLADYNENWYYHQDIASQICCAALDAKPGDRIADVCAAPGGKSFTLAQTVGDSGYILSCDLHAQKCDDMAKRAETLGFSTVHTAVRDASKPCPEALKGMFDRVLCDVPCSGLGVIRRKPEIRHKPMSEIAALPDLQYRILEQSADMVKAGGVLQYSTCTLNPAENERVVQRFLQNHPEFSPRTLPISAVFERLGIAPSWQVTLFPFATETDGFFVAGFTREAAL